MRLRKLVIATHRDLGYFFAGLTVIYAISGIAVNHIDDWNPNYVIEHTTHELGELDNTASQALATEVLQRLDIHEQPLSVVRTAPDLLEIFLEGRSLAVAIPTGQVTEERVSRRLAFFEANYLHLNHGKGLWTLFADVYALALLILATTGIFIIPGKKGLAGRGRWLLLAGLAIPVLYLVVRL